MLFIATRRIEHYAAAIQPMLAPDVKFRLAPTCAASRGKVRDDIFTEITDRERQGPPWRRTHRRDAALLPRAAYHRAGPGHPGAVIGG